MRSKTFGNSHHGAYRKACQRHHDLIAATVLASYRTARPVLRFEEPARSLVEFLQYIVAALLPVLALKKHNEVIAADVTDEIPAGIAVTCEDSSRDLDHFIAERVSINVV